MGPKRVAGGLDLAVAQRQANERGVRCRHGVIDQQGKRNDQGSERYALHVDLKDRHDREHDRKRERDRQRDDQARTNAEADEAHDQNDGDRLQQRGHELADRLAHDDGLVGHQARLDPDRQISGDPHHLRLDVPAQREDVAAIAHGNGKPNRRTAIDPEQWLGWIGVTPPHHRKVAQAQHATAGGEVDIGNVLLGQEAARHPQRYPLRAGLNRSRRHHDVLRPQRRDQGRAIDAEICKLLLGELDEDHFLLCAQQLDLRDIRYSQELRTDRLDPVTQLALRKAVAGEAVDDAKGVAEIVVEERPDDTGRQRMANVADRLPYVVPGIGDIPRIGASLEVHEDGREARPGEAAQEIQMRGLLQLALEALRQLLHRLVGRRPWPDGMNDHGPDREGGILVPAQPEI
ncbi:hypothetical protein ABH973_000003 [Bradyrhizobium ottawaense]